MEAATATKPVRLWELGDELEAIGHELMENGGELTPELEARLDAIQGAWEEKVERIALFIRTHIANGLAADVECSRLERIRSSHERTAENLKAYLKREMEKVGHLSVKTPRVRVWVQANGGLPSIKWTRRPEDLPEDFKKVTLSVNSEAVKKAFGDGTLPTGFVVEPRGSHIRVS